MRTKYFFYLLIFLFIAIGCKKENKTIGTQIEGDFNGDGKTEIAVLEYLGVKQATNVLLFKYSVTFTDENIKPIIIETTYRKLQLINEGDLNGDNADDISISQEIHPKAPFSTMQTQSFSDNKWNYIITHITIHLGFETLRPEQLQDVVTKKGKSIIYYTYDSSSLEFDDNFIPQNNNKKFEEIKLE